MTALSSGGVRDKVLTPRKRSYQYKYERLSRSGRSSGSKGGVSFLFFGKAGHLKDQETDFVEFARRAAPAVDGFPVDVIVLDSAFRERAHDRLE